MLPRCSALSISCRVFCLYMLSRVFGLYFRGLGSMFLVGWSLIYKQTSCFRGIYPKAHEKRKKTFHNATCSPWGISWTYGALPPRVGGHHSRALRSLVDRETWSLRPVNPRMHASPHPLFTVLTCGSAIIQVGNSPGQSLGSCAINFVLTIT